VSFEKLSSFLPENVGRSFILRDKFYVSVGFLLISRTWNKEWNVELHKSNGLLFKGTSLIIHVFFFFWRADAYDRGRTNHEADAKAGLADNDCAMIESKTLLTGKSQCPPSEGTACRIFRNDCIAERCTAAGAILCQDINDEPGSSDIAKVLTIGHSDDLPIEMPTTDVKYNRNEDPPGSQVQAFACASVKKNILSFPSSQPSIDEKPRNSLPSTVMLDSVRDTAKKDPAVPQ